MTRISFIKPNYPGERRVALFPDQVGPLISLGFQVVVESKFGSTLGIADREYQQSGAEVVSRKDCFEESLVFSLKLIQQPDYKYLRKAQTIIGWSHPLGSGRFFWENQCQELGIKLIDLDSVSPRLYNPGQEAENLNFLPPHMFWKNSYHAGVGSINIALKSRDEKLRASSEVCVLGTGSVAQGAFYRLSRLGVEPRMFGRKTLPIFLDTISTFDVIVNGIEVDTPGKNIISTADLLRTKEDVLLIDAAADAGNAIEGTEYHTMEQPLSTVRGREYILVPNAPSAVYRQASRDISTVLIRDVFPKLISINYWRGLEKLSLS